MGSITERETDKQPCNVKNSLQTAIVVELAKINPHYLIRACSHFQSQIQYIIEAEDGCIQQPSKTAVKETM